MPLAFYFLLIYFNVNAKSHSYSLPLPTWTSINNTVTKALCNMFLRKLKNKTKEKFIRMQTNGYFLLARARKREFGVFLAPNSYDYAWSFI